MGSCELPIATGNWGPELVTTADLANKDALMGTLVFNTDTKTVWFYDGTEWKELVAATPNTNE